MKKNLAFFLLFLTIFHFVGAEEAYQVIDNQAKLPLLTPDLKKQQTLKLRLKNGLEAYIISDPDTDQSGAMLSVNAGSWDEPKDHPGIAHYLEHMLFLGTKKYPDESGYQRYIIENGGSTNAFTTNSYTSYLFSVRNNAFDEALDRFSQFFQEPLFNPSGVSRELNAIDQEYAKNLENDDVRLTFVDKALANPEHPYTRFNMGNRKSLSNVSRETFENWYRTHYSANLMHLIIYSNQPLEKLKELVVNDFSGVPNVNAKPFSSDLKVLSDDRAEKIVYVEPIQNKRNLTLLWELPSQFGKMKNTQPDKIVCYVLGHEGEESLLAELKRRKLAERLECGRVKLGSDNSLFYIDIGLTEKGVKENNEVIALVYQAVRNFKEKGTPEYLFNELQRMETTNYQYQSREDVFSHLMKHAQWMINEEIETYPEKTLIIQKYSPEDVQALLNKLTPQNMHIYLMVPSKLTAVKYDQMEPWAQVPYTIKPIEKNVIQQWENVVNNTQIDLPAVNPFIPKELTVIYENEDKAKTLVPRPQELVSNDKSLIYVAQDEKFNVPEIFWHFEIKTPYVELGNPSKVVLADLYVKALSESLKKFTYSASLAGLHYEINRADNGIEINIFGYSDNAGLLFGEIVKRLRNLNINDLEFQIYKESLSLDYQNYSKKPPVEQAIELLKSVLFKQYATNGEKALAINQVTLEKFNEYALHIFDDVFVEGLLFGNVNEESANPSVKQLMEIFSESHAYTKEKQQPREVIILPNDQGPFYLESEIKSQGNAALLALEHPNSDIKERSVQQILMQAIEEPFYSDLRTKQQTGYLVFSTGEEIRKQLFDIFAVQSNSHNVRDLLARFELFIERYLQEINSEIPEERFIRIKNTLEEMLEHPAKNVKEMGELLKRLAFEYKDFEWIDKRLQSMKELKYNDFMSISREILSVNNRRRFAILLKGIVPKNILDFTPIHSAIKLKKLSTFTTGFPQEK